MRLDQLLRGSSETFFNRQRWSLLLGTSQGVRWSSGELSDTASSEICFMHTRTLILAGGTRQAFSLCIERMREEGRLCVVPPREENIFKQNAEVHMQGIIADQVCFSSRVLRDEVNTSKYQHARRSTQGYGYSNLLGSLAESVSFYVLYSRKAHFLRLSYLCGAAYVILESNIFMSRTLEIRFGGNPMYPSGREGPAVMLP